MHSKSRIANADSIQVYSTGYYGPTYSVKYLGIVDGSMGILSRKMAMQGSETTAKPLSTVDLPSKVSEQTL